VCVQPKMIACDRSREVRYILSLYEQMCGLMLIFIHESEAQLW
jgi:hypothetical protein